MNYLLKLASQFQQQAEEYLESSQMPTSVKYLRQATTIDSAEFLATDEHDLINQINHHLKEQQVPATRQPGKLTTIPGFKVKKSSQPSENPNDILFDIYRIGFNPHKLLRLRGVKLLARRDNQSAIDFTSATGKIPYTTYLVSLHD